MVVPTLGGACPTSIVFNAQATIGRVWFAQTHLMETHWPFFYLVENRPTLAKVDVSAPSGTPVPTVSVTATFADGRSERLCLRAPASLPSAVDTRPQPLQQDLNSSFAATLPATWLQKGVSVNFEVAGGASAARSAADLKITSQPEMNLVLADVLLFGDTNPEPRPALFGPELASKLPISRLTLQPLPYALSLPRLVIGPRTDSVSPFGDKVESAAMWVDSKPQCASWNKTAGTCRPQSRYAVWEAVLELSLALQAANGLSETAFWYAIEGVGSHLNTADGWWYEGPAALGDDFGLHFLHEHGHALGVPHLGEVTGARQKNPAGWKHPYVGENVRSDGQFYGGGYGRTFAWDPLDNALVPPTCPDTGLEKQEPVQRVGCTGVRPGRSMDHFSDITAYELLRMFNGAPQIASGNVAYYSKLLAGSSADAFAQVPYRLPVTSGRVRTVQQGGTQSLQRWDAATDAYVSLLRPPGGDSGFLTAPPAAPAGSEYVQHYDFRFPQQLNVPVISVYGSFNYMDDATSAIYAAKATKGNLMRLWDPTNATQFGQIQQSVSTATFWSGYDLHLRVYYQDGSVRHVAMPFEAKPVTTPMQGFTHWAVNLPDEGKAVVRIELLHRPLCSRNASAADRSCDVNLASNGISAANVYAGARVAAVWTP